MRILKIVLMILTIGYQSSSFAAGESVKLYRNPNCGCCNAYADYLKDKGYTVELVNITDMTSIKKKYSVPEALEGCHTAIIDRYIFEGLIPAEHIKRFLSENKPAKGLSLPGMPAGVPGMPGNRTGRLNVYYISNAASPQIFANF